MNEQITVGTEIIAKIGRNEVEAIITETSANVLKARSKRSGKEFTVKTIVKVLTPEAPAVEPAPVIPEAPTAEQPAKKLSLLKAAFQVLKSTGSAMNVKEILAKVQEQGLWQPMAGKTPENTLYAAILREINTKEAPMFKRCDSRKGSFESAC